MADLVEVGSLEYCALLALLLFARGMDFLSTWIATPNLVLEANPIAKRLGWRGGVGINLVLCFVFAAWPLPAIVITTASVLVAARNLQSAWLMRSLGEQRYRCWVAERVGEAHFGLYLFCLLGQTALVGMVGGALMYFSGLNLIPFAVGMGIVTYALAVAIYTLLALWRIRRSMN